MSEPLSRRNPEVARLRALARQRAVRHETGRFIVEGVKLVDEVLRSSLTVLDIFVDADWLVPTELLFAIEGADLEPLQLAAGGIARIASTSSPQPIVAEVELPLTDWPSADSSGTPAMGVARAQALLVAVDINDPGNVGTLVRSAVAAGFDAMVALGETADPFGPKAVRASAGAMFRLPVVVDGDVAGGLDHIAASGLERIGTRMVDAEPCDQVDLTGAVALVLGSEAHGLDDEYQTHIDRWVGVPMSGDVESLNVAMAGTILTYEIARQRRTAA